MTRVLQWIWNRGIVSTFLAGLFAILPLAITVGILTWIMTYLNQLMGPGSTLGQRLRIPTVENEILAWLIGLVFVAAGIWVLGLLMKSAARRRIERAFNRVVEHIPIVKSVYGTASQLVAMLKADDETEMHSMSVVFCSFGQARGGGVLCLLASPEVYRFNDREYRVVYMPTSPIPMTGGIIFVPTEMIEPIDMTAEQMMRIYLSMGILSPEVMPKSHVVAPATQ